MLTLQLTLAAFYLAALVYSLRIYSKPLYVGYWLLGLWEWLTEPFTHRRARLRYWRWRSRVEHLREAVRSADKLIFEVAINAHIAAPRLPDGERPRFVIGDSADDHAPSSQTISEGSS